MLAKHVHPQFSLTDTGQTPNSVHTFWPLTRNVFLCGGTRSPQPVLMGFIDQMRAEGFAVESIFRVLREQGCHIAARTYRNWKHAGRNITRIAARTITDAQVMNAVRDVAWRVDHTGRKKLNAEGLYGRRKMTAHLRRLDLPHVSRGAVDRAMCALGLEGVRRDKGIRTTIPAKDGIRAGDLLNRDFSAQEPNKVWVTDFTYVRT